MRPQLRPKKPAWGRKRASDHALAHQNYALPINTWQDSEPVQEVEAAMNRLKLAPTLATTGIAIVSALVLLGSLPLHAQTPSTAAAHIQTYYQELMPTIRQAARLTVRERDKRFAPAITSAF